MKNTLKWFFAGLVVLITVLWLAPAAEEVWIATMRLVIL